MAQFNVSPGQPNDPNYLNYSRPVAEPAADVSKGMALQAAATGLHGLVGALDTSVKEGIKNKAYDAVDKERDQFTEGLEKVKSQLDNGTVAAPVQGAGTGKSLIMDASQDEPELPEGLQAGLDRVQQLSAAKAAGSIKINDTQYAGNVLSIAKQLRSQYGSGYREYIDDTISKASGLPVANSYYQNLMIDINRQLNQLGKAKDDVGTTMMKNLDVPQMGTYINMRKAGDPRYPGDAAMLEKISDWQNLQSQQRIDAAKRAESTDNKKVNVDQEESNVTKNLNNLVYHHINDNLALSGMPTLRDVLNYFSNPQRNTKSDVEAQQQTQYLIAYRQYLYQEAKKMTVGPDSVIGNKKAEELISNALTPIDTYIQLAKDKDSGPAVYSLHLNQAIKNDDERNWLFSKDKGAQARQILTARGILGEQYFPDYIRSMLANGTDKPFADLFSQEALAAVAPISTMEGVALPPRTMVDAVKHAKEVGVPEGEYFGKIAGWLEQVADPKMPNAAKDNIIRWGFNKPGVTDELKMDYRDPNTGQWVDGKYRALNLMTSDKIMQAVGDTAKAKPENYAVAKNWTEGEFGKLFRSDLQTLNKVNDKPYLGVHFSYDDTTKHFGLVDNKNRPIVRNDRVTGIENPNQVYINGMLDTLDRVNSGTDALKRVYKYNPQGDQAGSVDKYLLQTLQTAGFRPGENLTGATADMAKALVRTLKPGATPEQINQLILGK